MDHTVNNISTLVPLSIVEQCIIKTEESHILNVAGIKYVGQQLVVERIDASEEKNC